MQAMIHRLYLRYRRWVERVLANREHDDGGTFLFPEREK